MIGSAKITYTNENVCELVRRDLVDKFGNRELANYNLYLPGVVKAKALIKEYPNPEVKVITVEEQIRDMGVYPGPKVPRATDSVRVCNDASLLSSTFDRNNRKLVISGGPVKFNAGIHEYCIEVDFPAGFTYEEGISIPYSVNNKPAFVTLSATEIESNSLIIPLDAKFTTANVIINWNDAYEPEFIAITCNASLESTAIDKIPAFPTTPKFEFTYPEVTTDANVQVDVDLDLGKA